MAGSSLADILQYPFTHPMSNSHDTKLHGKYLHITDIHVSMVHVYV